MTLFRKILEFKYRYQNFYFNNNNKTQSKKKEFSSMKLMKKK